MSVGGAVEHSDNIDRLEVGRDETTLTANTEFLVLTEARRFDFNLEGLFSHNTYLNETFGDEFRGDAFGELVVDISGETLQWITQDNFAQQRFSILLPNTPDNRQNVNVFRTGPRFATRIGQRGEASLQAIYQTSDFEDTTQDSDVIGGYLTLSRAVRETSIFTVNGSFRQVRFDAENVFDDFDIIEAYIGWQVAGGRTQFDLQAGYSEIESDDASGENIDDGYLFRLNISRDFFGRSILVLDARSELTTTEDAFRFSQELRRPELTPQAQVANGEPFRFEYLGLSWNTLGDRLDVLVDAFYESREFSVTTANDRDRRAVRLTVNRAFSENFSFGVFGEASDELFQLGAQDFEEIAYGVRIDVRPMRRLQFSLFLSRVDRSTDAVNLSFEENLARLNFTYDLFGDRSLRRQLRLNR